MIKSPCVDKCQMNPSTNMCEGCFRTIDEISDWSGYSNNQKVYVLELIKKRKNA